MIAFALSKGVIAHVSRHVGVPEDLVKSLAEQHFCSQARLASLCSTERLDADQMHFDSVPVRTCSTILSAPEPAAAASQHNSVATSSTDVRIDASRLKMANTCSACRLRHSFAVSRRLTRDSARRLRKSSRRGVGADVDTPARQPCCESRILALATDGERQLIIRYHDTRSSQALIDHDYRGHLCRR